MKEWVVESTPKNSGNPEKVLEWCENLENHKWETIPNGAVKRMLWSCTTGPARREIVPFYPTGLAFKSHETGLLFTEMLERFHKRKARNRNP